MSSDIAKVNIPHAASGEDQTAAQLDSAELESRQKFWRWLLLAGMGCLALEAVVGFRLERRQATTA
jgi:hypothetical protein